MAATPQSITIYGAGVVGCEYASMFRNLGVKVNLVNTRDKLLEFLDDEIIDALTYHLREHGVLIRHNEEYERVEGRDDGVILHLKSGKKIKTDVLLWANGRTGNTDGWDSSDRHHPQSARPDRGERGLSDRGAAHLRRRRRDRLSVAGQRRVRSGTLRARTCCTAHSDQLRRIIPTGIYTSPRSAPSAAPSAS